MDSTSSDARRRERGGDEFGTTRRALLAAGGTVALTGLAGCAALDGLMDRAGEQVIGTTSSAPAAFYPGRASSGASASHAGVYGRGGGMQSFSTAASTHQVSDGPQVFRTGPSDVRQVPATARAEGREISLEGWSTGGVTKAQDYNAARSNKPSSEWWAGPDDEDDDDEDGDILVEILDVELDLVAYVAIARDAVERRASEEAKRALDAFIDATENALRPALDKCGTGVCETVRENSDIRVEGVRQASDAIDEENWTVAVRELAGVDEVVLGDVERLDDELAERRPGRPRFIDIIRYMRDEPTIGERFTLCLPDAKLPGDLGGLTEQLTPGRLLANGLIDEVREDDKVEYRLGSGNGDDSCVAPDPSESIVLHQDISCGTILSAELDMKATENRAMVGYSTEGGAVVSGAPASADTDGKCVFVAADGTLREPESLDSWGPERTTGDVSVSGTLVCPVTVTPEDCPCPLPGLFFVRRLIHDDQVIFAGGWTLDEGALYEGSATLLFEEGPTEVASLTAEDVDSGNIDDRIVEQFSRARSEHGSGITFVDSDDDNDGIPSALQSGAGRDGLDAVNTKATGGPRGEISVVKQKRTMAGLDAPIIHLAGARELSSERKQDLIVPVAMDKGLR